MAEAYAKLRHSPPCPSLSYLASLRLNTPSVNALHLLPLEVWVQLAGSGTSETWLNLCCAVAGVGKYSLNQDVQSKMMDKFVSKSANGEYRLPNGELHSYHDRPAVKHYRLDGTLYCERWFRNGKVYRKEGPAEKIYYEDGTLWREYWYRHGVLHRGGDQPAGKWYRKGGTTLRCERWFQKGKLHRGGDQPAAKQYTGTLYYEK